MKFNLNHEMAVRKMRLDRSANSYAPGLYQEFFGGYWTAWWYEKPLIEGGSPAIWMAFGSSKDPEDAAISLMEELAKTGRRWTLEGREICPMTIQIMLTNSPI
jgi:hypothetical protein